MSLLRPGGSAADQLSLCFRRALKLLSSPLDKTFYPLTAAKVESWFCCNQSILYWPSTSHTMPSWKSLFITVQWLSEKYLAIIPDWDEMGENIQKKKAAVNQNRWGYCLSLIICLILILFCAFLFSPNLIWHFLLTTFQVVFSDWLLVFCFSVENVRFYTFVLCVHL